VSLEPQTGSPLQFDTARPANVSAASPTAADVTCVVCGQTIADEYYDVNAQPACRRCKQQLADLGETPKGFGAFSKAALFGVAAAILGAIVYYAVVAITNFEIGIVAIAIGYMVGYAVRVGASHRGGRRFQVLAIVLTYWAVGLAYTPLVFKAIAEVKKPAAISAAQPAAPATPPAPDDSGCGMSLVLALAVLFAMPFGLPVLAVIGGLPGSLISGAIIAFGMQQAWRMTGAPQFVITGPYRIARSVA
jgi:hypothetical protein